MAQGEGSPSRGRLIVVEDDDDVLRSVTRVLVRAGFAVEPFAIPTEALAAIAAGGEEPDAVLSDVRMPELSGIDLLRSIRERGTDVPVILMTGHGDVRSAIEAIRLGAYDYISKPLDATELVATIERATDHRRLLARNRYLERQLDLRTRFDDIIGASAPMQRVFALIESVAPVDATVLVLGESGTGKELIARAIHRRSARKQKPLVAINCAALTESLLESELFGHARGAFTGANAARRGLFDEASGGTLFLDEVADLSPATQVKLLRALQEGEIRPVGSNESHRVDVRIVAATNRSLVECVAAGTFREDLYYRLNVIEIDLPPLRERVEDIPVLAQHFLQKHAKRLGKNVTTIEPAALDRLRHHNWPGNVRELEHAIERGVILAKGESIGPEAVPTIPGMPRAGTGSVVGAALDKPFPQAKQDAMAAFERSYVESVLGRAGGSIAEGARIAGLDPSNFRRLMRRAGVEG